MKQFLSLKQAADLLGVDYKTIYNLIRTGQLPAARIGNIYRIRREDLDAFFERQKGQPGVAPSPVGRWSQVEYPKANCARCGIVIRYPSLVGGACKEEPCEAVLCRQCWANFPDRKCSLHSLVQKEEGLERTRSAVVTAEEAAQWGLQFIAGFDLAMRDRTSVQSPIDGSSHSITDWNSVHHEEPALLPSFRHGSAVLRSGGASGALPKNLSSCYHFRLKEQYPGSSSFAIMALALIHVESYQATGADSDPATLVELTRFLEAASDLAKREEAVYIAGLASPTGWDPKAIQTVSGDQGKKGFSSLYLSFCLIDLRSMSLFFNPGDVRLRPYLDAFRGFRREDLIKDIQRQIQDALLTREGQSVKEVSRATGQPEELVNKAFEMLQRTGLYEVRRLPRAGLVISKKG